MNVGTVVKHKFLESSNMTFQEVFDFAFKTFIPDLRSLAEELGEAQVLAALKKVAFESALKAGQADARQLPSNDFAAFNAWAREPNHFWKHVLTFEIVEDSPQAFEVKVTECLWAKTFQEIGAADIGHLLICHPDYAYCQGFNPKITMRRSRTLMQGDNYCNHRWVWEE
jgi:L-2-amino-thiazoline-4-carboxylic acid hydrolase